MYLLKISESPPTLEVSSNWPLPIDQVGLCTPFCRGNWRGDLFRLIETCRLNIDPSLPIFDFWSFGWFYSYLNVLYNSHQIIVSLSQPKEIYPKWRKMNGTWHSDEVDAILRYWNKISFAETCPGWATNQRENSAACFLTESHPPQSHFPEKRTLLSYSNR